MTPPTPPNEHEPRLRWFAPEATSLMGAALDTVRASFGGEIPGPRRVSQSCARNRTIVSVDPADPSKDRRRLGLLWRDRS